MFKINCVIIQQHDNIVNVLKMVQIIQHFVSRTIFCNKSTSESDELLSIFSNFFYSALLLVFSPTFVSFFLHFTFAFKYFFFVVFSNFCFLIDCKLCSEFSIIINSIWFTKIKGTIQFLRQNWICFNTTSMFLNILQKTVHHDFLVKPIQLQELNLICSFIRTRRKTYAAGILFPTVKMKPRIVTDAPVLLYYFGNTFGGLKNYFALAKVISVFNFNKDVKLICLIDERSTTLHITLIACEYQGLKFLDYESFQP